jgi:hypothetical protein
MGRRPRLTLVLALAAAAVPGASAAADTTLFQDDAEGKVEDHWIVQPPKDSRIKPWQKSDSETDKLRGNQAHGGMTSYWAGMQPEDYPLPVDVVAGDDIMVLKEPLVIPADGTTTIDFWSLYQNEGDDVGLVEAAPVTDGTPVWTRVARVLPPASATGDPYVPGYCDPSHPVETLSEGFTAVKGSFAAFAGQKVLIRFNMKYGGENRTITQPCGWYVDDIKITTTGTPGRLASPAAAPSVTVTGLRLRARKATLALKVSGATISKAKISLTRGGKAVATARSKRLAPGTRRIVFKTKRPLRPGTYVVKITGAAPDGSAFKGGGKVRARPG